MPNGEGLPQGGQERFANRRLFGTVLEAVGAIGGFVNLVGADIAGALAGGAVFILGRWIKNSGQQSPQHA